MLSLSLNSNFAPFIVEGTTWGTKSTPPPPTWVYRPPGGQTGGEFSGTRSWSDRKLFLNHISKHVGQKLNLNTVYLHIIWGHFGFQMTGAHFLVLANLCLEPNWHPEERYPRITAFVEGSLFQANGLFHHGMRLTEDEDSENLIVLTCIKLINPDLFIKSGHRWTKI